MPKFDGHSGLGEYSFRREGQYWTIVYRDQVVRLRDSKGLRYIALLLTHPGTRFAARDLMQEVAADGADPTEGLEPASTDVSSGDPSSRDEQARLAVTKRIKASVKAIETYHPALAYHLAAAVKTGGYCMYLPDPTHPTIWTT